jgi:hypothetical protein
MTKTKFLTATVTDVLIGLLVIEGLMDENSDFYVGVPQAADIFETSRNIAARDFKRLLGEAFKTSDLKTEFNKYKTLGMPLSVFELLLNSLDRKGNIKAQELRDSLAGLSLHQLFCDAFKIKFEAQERQEWLKTRMLTKETFWFMGSAIESYYLRHPRIEKYPNQNYSEAFDALNKALFGKKSRDIKAILGIGKNTLNRDHFGKESLKKIEMIQRIAEAQIDHQDVKPVDAVKFAVGIMNYQVSDFRD